MSHDCALGSAMGILCIKLENATALGLAYPAARSYNT